MSGEPDRAGRPARARGRPLRAFTYIELLVASLILVIAASGVVASLRLLPAVPRNKRITEMGIYIGSQELERLKAQTYDLLSKNSNGTDWYDKSGAWISSNGSAPPGALYRANWSVPLTSNGTGGVDRDSTVNSEDLIELIVTVTDKDQTIPYGTARTLLAFGAE